MIVALLTLYLLSLSLLVASLSTGVDIYYCDVKSDIWGCDPARWLYDDRLDCMDKANRTMSWATRPQRSDAYRIVVGEDGQEVTQYYPGEYVQVNIYVDTFKMEYRGLMLYARSVQTGEKVGEWSVTDPRFIESPICDKSVVHATAELKPYRITFNFVITDEGFGDITFEAMIKYGDANTGDFFWPEDVTISEAEPRERIWYTTLKGQSCSGLCTSLGMGCDPTAVVDTMDEMEEVMRYQACRLPLLSGCYTGGSATGSSNYCYLQNEDTCDAIGKSVTVDCNSNTASANYGQRFCACITDGGITGDTTPNTVVTDHTEDDSLSLEETGDHNSSSKSTLSTTLMLSSMLLCSFFNKEKSFLRVLFAFFIIASMMHTTDAHNWINSPSRASGASTVNPCPARISTKPHIQVGPGQEFIMEWMVGHQGRDTYFIIVHESDEDKLVLHNESIIDDYLAGGTTNLGSDAYWNKFHRKPDNSLAEGFFKSIVSSGPNYITRPESFTTQVTGDGFLLDYEVEDLSRDARVSYQSSTYDWIESAHRFDHISHLPKLRFDTARFVIPGRKGPGRYIIHYMFGGYRDCVDVDLLDSEVAEPYGVESVEDSWSKIDHCFFEDPIEISTPCNEAFVGAQEPGWCKTACAGLGKCHGLNVVPLYNTKSKFPDISLIPFDNGVCADAAAVAQFENAPEDTYVCYGVKPRAETDVLGKYTVTDDPEHPYFYSTCYIKQQARSFLPSPSVAEPITPWIYNDRCISCDDYNIITQIKPIFDYPQAEVCINCDLEDGEVPERATNMVQIMNGSACDGYSGGFNARLESSEHIDGSTCSTYDCFQQLKPLGTNVDIAQEEDCEMLARRNSNCSNYVWIQKDKYRAGCFCYKNLDCCKTCSGVVGYRNSIEHYDSFTLYEIDPPSADPTCDSGTLSADGKQCCPGSCTTCSDTINTEVGFCSYSGKFIRSCDDYGAPCNMN